METKFEMRAQNIYRNFNSSREDFYLTKNKKEEFYNE